MEKRSEREAIIGLVILIAVGAVVAALGEKVNIPSFDAQPTGLITGIASDDVTEAWHQTPFLQGEVYTQSASRIVYDPGTGNCLVRNGQGEIAAVACLDACKVHVNGKEYIDNVCASQGGFAPRRL